MVTLRNGGAFPLNVTTIAGSVNLVEFFPQFIQNLSAVGYTGVTVYPSTDVSLNYNIRLHQKLGGVKYQIALTVLYNAEGVAYGQTFFNSTVEVLELPGEMMSLWYLLAAVAIAVCGYRVSFTPEGRKFVATHATQLGAAPTKSTTQPSGRPPVASASTSAPNEWLEGTCVFCWKLRRSCVIFAVVTDACYCSSLHVGKKAAQKKAAKK